MDNQSSSKTLIICYSYHHKNTLKVAQAMADILNAKLISLEEINDVDLNGYGLIGFGSGIDSGNHYQLLLSFVKDLPIENDKLSFIFSTSATQGKRKVFKDHTALRNVLLSKGYTILDEFSCKGFNTNGFLKFFGGMNKGRPNALDIKSSENFASQLKQNI